MCSTDANGLLDLVEVRRREQSRAEATTLKLMLDFADARQAEAEATLTGQQLHWAVSAIADELADVLDCSVNRVRNQLYRARLVRAQLPNTWLGFLTGELTAYALCEIGLIAGRLEQDASFARLDQRVMTYARTHSTAQLLQWLARRVASLEPQTAAERRSRARDERRVFITHGEADSELWAKLPTEAALAIEASLRASLKAKTGDDERSIDQYLADQVHRRLTRTPDDETLVHTEVVVTVPVTTLAGLNEAPGATLDERVLLPAGTVRALAVAEGTVFHRAITDPVGTILDVTRLGRCYTGTLRTAITIRDGRCQFPGCTRPGIEIDHITPWPAGPTTASNGQLLCKRHHQLKTFGIVTIDSHQGTHLWTLPSGRRRPPQRVTHPPGAGLPQPIALDIEYLPTG